MSVDLVNAYTQLTLTGIGIAPYSARGLHQTLQPIQASSQVRRTINGELVDTSVAQFRKFKSTISGSDQTSPLLSGVWPGMEVTVECIVEMAGTPDRTAVSGSTRTEEGVTFFRPVLVMKVVDYSIDTDEYGAQVGWKLDLEEV